MFALKRQLFRLPSTVRQSLYFADKAGGDKSGKTATKPPSKPQPPTKPLKMSIIPYREIHVEEDTFQQNLRMGRSYSPHMTIYEPQLTSILSYVHRLCGCAVSGYITCLGLAAVVFPNGMLDYIAFYEDLQLPGAVLLLLKLMLTLPFCFHFTNGIRHLIWDSGHCLTIPEVYKTGYGAIGLAVVMGVVLAFL